MGKKKVIDEDYTDDDESKGDLALDLIVDDLKKATGNVAYILGRGDTEVQEVTEWLSTGSTLLDACIANDPNATGGIPVGRLTEIWGEEATGKSLVAYMVMKDCQEKGGICVLIDSENSVNLKFLNMLGLKMGKNLIYCPVQTTEEVFDVIESVVRRVREDNKKQLVTVVWDSVAATSTKAEIEGDYGDATIGLQARLIGQGLRKIIGFVNKQRFAMVFLNQVRMKIGSSAMFGDPMTTPGGKAIPFFSSVRVRLLSGGKIKADKDVIGAVVKAKVNKNRMGPPHRECKFSVYFDKGVVDEDTWLEPLIEFKIAKKMNNLKSSIEFEGQTHEFRSKKLSEYLEKEPKLKEWLKKRLKEEMYVEQDPSKRNEDFTVEELEGDEEV